MNDAVNAMIGLGAMAAILWTGYDLHRRHRWPF